MGLFNLFFSLCNHTLTTLITSGAKMISLLRGIASFASFIRRITLLVLFYFLFLWDVSIIWENSGVKWETERGIESVSWDQWGNVGEGMV